MNEFEALHQKLDRLTTEITSIKKLLSKQGAVISQDQPLNIKQAAVFTSLSIPTIYKLVHYRKLQPLQRKKRGKLLFLKESLLDFLNHKSSDLPLNRLNENKIKPI